MNRDPATILVVANIQALMRERGMDMATLNRAAKLGPTGVNDILSGKTRTPTVETIAKIAKALGVPTPFMFEEHEGYDLRADLLAVYDSLPERERELLLQTARSWQSAQRTA